MPFDSGELTLWHGESTASPGGMPVTTYNKAWGSYYENRTIGVNRYYAAQQFGDRADALVRVPRTYLISPAEDRITLSPYSHEDGNAYRITQKQDVLDNDGLPATDLTLERDDGLDAERIAGNAGGTD